MSSRLRRLQDFIVDGYRVLMEPENATSHWFAPSSSSAGGSSDEATEVAGSADFPTMVELLSLAATVSLSGCIESSEPSSGDSTAAFTSID